jgi:hypothetical protein
MSDEPGVPIVKKRDPKKLYQLHPLAIASGYLFVAQIKFETI